ncbi:cyclophilin-like fold protein [Prevotella dentasini]|uniref:cyclophilin-like fold protein n=1 Tax=Prevotella dentasini TaxID=589537 RepID=UPI000B030795|nr:cyclophilin-like fold protein [Prevotella dentasini]
MRINIKTALTALFMSGLAISTTGCSKDGSDETVSPTPIQPPVPNDETDTGTGTTPSAEGRKITLKAANHTLGMTLTDNAATRQLVALCSNGDITVEMHEYGGFEMVGSLPQALPASDTQTTTTAGDVVLYNGNQLVIFFGSNSWSYTRLGKIDNAGSTTIRNFFGGDTATVVLSLQGQ